MIVLWDEVLQGGKLGKPRVEHSARGWPVFFWSQSIAVSVRSCTDIARWLHHGQLFPMTGLAVIAFVQTIRHSLVMAWEDGTVQQFT